MHLMLGQGSLFSRQQKELLVIREQKKGSGGRRIWAKVQVLPEQPGWQIGIDSCQRIQSQSRPLYAQQALSIE